MEEHLLADGRPVKGSRKYHVNIKESEGWDHEVSLVDLAKQHGIYPICFNMAVRVKTITGKSAIVSAPIYPCMRFNLPWVCGPYP